MQIENEALFRYEKIHKAVLALVIPTILSQLAAVVYNMSDAFWIGQLNNPAEVAAATLCVPTMLLILGIVNVFGIGGASLIARSLGLNQKTKARETCAFCVWTSCLLSLVYAGIFSLFSQDILYKIGATEETYQYCLDYTFWTVIVGATPATMSGLFGHLVRSEGYAKQASIGTILGLVLNMVLDPIFIFVFKLEIVGAAIATMLSMVISVIYFVWFIWSRGGRSVLSLNPWYYSLQKDIVSEVIWVGLPSSVMSLMATASNIVLNVLTAGYSTAAIAGMGIAKRIDMLAFALANGIGQGVLPLIGYNFSSKNYARMRSAIRITLMDSLILSLVVTLGLFLGAEKVSRWFIEDAETVAYGEMFLKIICLTCPCVSLTLLMMTIFQAAGKKVQPIILSVVRKGGLDIPLMFGLNAWLGVTGLAWAIPVEDILAMLLAIGLFVPFWRSLKNAEEKNTSSS